MYYCIEEGHKPFTADKFTDKNFNIFTLAAIDRELSQQILTKAEVQYYSGTSSDLGKTKHGNFLS